MSVVIPTYGSEGSIDLLVKRIVDVLRSTAVRFEIICVNDDSPDDVWNKLVALQLQYPELTAICLMRNFGQHNATMCGFAHARGKVVVTMDDDLQHDPAEIPRLLERMREGNLDVVYGSYEVKKHSWYRNLGSLVINQVFRRVFQIPFNFSSFRAIRLPIIAAITKYNLNFTFIDGLIAWTTRRIGAVKIVHHDRLTGRSGYRLGKLLLLALNLVTNFSIAPLQIASLVGVLAAIGGFVAGTSFLVAYFFGGIAVPGFASTITAVLILGGLQLVALGTIGEYVGRLHLNFNKKPQFVIRETHSDSSFKSNVTSATELTTLDSTRSDS